MHNKHRLAWDPRQLPRVPMHLEAAQGCNQTEIYSLDPLWHFY